MPRFSIRGGPVQKRDFAFEESVLIGRGGTADLVLLDASVSRRHAYVVWNGKGDCRVEDLGSANGTFVNGHRVSQTVPLNFGDTVRVGDVVLEYCPDTAAISAPHPVTPSERPDTTAYQNVLVRVDATEASRRSSSADSVRLRRAFERSARISSMVFDQRTLLTFVVDELLETLTQADRAFVLLWDAELDRLVPGHARARAPNAERLTPSQTLLREAVARKEAVLVADVRIDPKYSVSHSIVGGQVRSIVCAPILFQQEILGVIQVDASTGREFDRSDLTSTLMLAQELGMALAYARLHEKLVERELVDRDLMLARQIQRHFLPASPPSVSGFNFSIEYRPALMVGGDLYDFVELEGGLLGVVAGDVSGKGVSAALYAAKVISDLRYQSAGQTSASSILQRLNGVLSAGEHEGMFVTLSMLVLDWRTGRLTVASAGHLLPLVRDLDGVVSTVGEIGDSALGVTDEARFAEQEYEMAPGDIVIIYTDGVIEALDRDGSIYGESRLRNVIARSVSDATAIVRAIDADVRTFAAGHPPSDDLTIVAFERVTNPPNQTRTIR